MTRQPRFEVCRDDDGWWARFRAANGRVVWVTETYRRQADATRAITLICNSSINRSPHADHPEINWGAHGLLEIHTIDERANRGMTSEAGA